MKSTIFNSQELNNYISMAITGYYPLFESTWLMESKTKKRMSVARANKNVKDVFTKIARHRSSDRKKMAINLMPEDERKLFIQSFMKLVEYNTLEKSRTLQ